MQTITPTDLHQRWQSANGQGLDLIDVRSPVEYRTVHATPADLMPLDTLDPDAVAQKRTGTDQPLYVICKSGARSAKACQKLTDAGQQNVVTVEGGTDAWVAAGLPVVRGKQAISLERQVRIGAGSLVVLGSILGLTLTPWFFALPIFVGCGLVFAGLTDWCGMGLLLAKMPWNR